MLNLWQDLRYAVRVLGKSPGFTLTTILTLALGIGAATAIFSIADAVLLRPLQFRNQDRLVEVFEDASKIGFPENSPAPANYIDWKQRNHVFADMAASATDNLNLTGVARPQEVIGTRMTVNMLPMLGISPVIGRNFTPEEDQAGFPMVAIISSQIWQQQFGGDPRILDRVIHLNGKPFQVIGVMPPGFTFPRESDVWVPLGLSAGQVNNRGNHWLFIFALLKPHVSLETARTEMRAIARQLSAEHPDTNTDIGAVVIPLRDEFVGDLRVGLYLLLAGVAVVLLIACANIAGLMLARATVAQRETTIRVAIGATRGDLIRQSLAHSLLLAFAGAVAGLALALAAQPFLWRMVPVPLQAWTRTGLDWRVGLFSLAVTTLSALAFGFFGMSRLPSQIHSALRENDRSSTSGRSNLRSGLVIAEIAFGLCVLVASALMVETLWRLNHVPLGFDPDHVLTMRTAVPLAPGSPYDDLRFRFRFYSAVIDRVSHLPGVISAGYTTFHPLSLTNRGGTSGFTIEGHPPLKLGEDNDANHRVISPDYLQTIGVRLIRGRFFSESDGPDSPHVALINEALARQYFPGEEPIGQHIQENGAAWTIVGIVGDTREMSIMRPARAEMYFPYTQDSIFEPRELAVRVVGDPMNYAEAVRKAIWAVDPQQPVAAVMPMRQLVDYEITAPDTEVKLLSFFALVSLLLVAVGIYGLISFSVAQRVREIGLRMALGANRGAILWQFLKSGMGLTAIGLALGMFLSLALAHAMRSLLYGISPDNPTSIGVACLAFVVISFTATFVPARRAASSEPMEALRTE